MTTDPLARRLSAIIGDSSAKQLARAFGMSTVGDLLAHYPRRYAHRGELSDFASLRDGEEVTVVATVVGGRSRPMAARRGTLQEIRISDGTGTLALTFFNQAWREQQLTEGKRGLFAGKVQLYRGVPQLTHPEVQLFDDETAEMNALERADWPIPIYPATGAVPSWRIASAIGIALDTLPEELPEPIPDGIRGRRGLLGIHEALELIHRPRRDADWEAARASLRYLEALVLQTALVQRRDRLRAARAVPRSGGPLLAQFDAALPFELTGDQAAAGEVIAGELAAPRPMHRLVQGEVGSGKTLVALRAMLAVAESGGQSALLAPTEVLAAQHLRSITRSLGPELATRLRPILLTGRMPTADRKRALLAAASGQSRIVVGTHALLGDQVSFADLGLVVVDEQHRFGVEQREALRAKGGEAAPHLLVLTATPIPRTVAMTVFGDLEVTTIRQLPAGRAPIESFVVPLAAKPAWAGRVWERLAEELAQGRQAFIVVPAIDAKQAEDGGEEVAADAPDDGPARPPATVVDTLAQLRSHPLLAERRIDALHGRMTAEEKEAVMTSFADGRIDVLVSTTVIEVGVDVPNASMMIVLDADRFGVSQLHQLRGRVGRGGLPGLALFVTAAAPETLALERVEAVASTLDGFALAERDLALRHEGDVLGAAQSGRRTGLRLLSAATDGEVIANARDDAIEIVAADPTLAAHSALADAIARRIDDEAAAFLTKG